MNKKYICLYLNVNIFAFILVLTWAYAFVFSGYKWNESGYRPPLCTYRLNWARRTSWGWWDDWDDTVLQTQDSKFEPWRSEAENATSRSRRLPQYWLSHVDGEETFLFFFQTAETGNRTPNSGVKGSGANHYPRAPALSGYKKWQQITPPYTIQCTPASIQMIQFPVFLCKGFFLTMFLHVSASLLIQMQCRNVQE